MGQIKSGLSMSPSALSGMRVVHANHTRRGRCARPPTSILARDSCSREFGRGGTRNDSAGHLGDVMDAQCECQGDMLVYALMVCLATIFPLSGKGCLVAQSPVLGYT